MPNLPPVRTQGRHASSPNARSLPQAGGRKRVYLDNHASTPCDPRVVEAMLPFFIDSFANPSSSIHLQGQEAARAVDQAREEVADTIGSSAGEIVFTSGATESNNLAIQGVARFAHQQRRRILASTIEHKCVLESCRWLGGNGFEFVPIPVLRDGLVDLSALVDLVDQQTVLVSVQAANNEIGTIQSIPEIAQIVHRTGALFHCDAAQALGRIPIDVGEWGVDVMSLSAHKCYGPKGVGALFVRGGRAAPIAPMFFGGGQEMGLRSGTLNTPGIVGFAKACQIARDEMPEESARLGHLRDWFERTVLGTIEGVSRNGALSRRLPGNSSLYFAGVEAEALIANMPGIAISTGSACASGALEPSHVLTAIGLSRADAYGTLRVGLGRFTMEMELEYAISQLRQAVGVVRGLAA